MNKNYLIEFRLLTPDTDIPAQQPQIIYLPQRKRLTGDEGGRHINCGPFQFGLLPMEVQEQILMYVAVARRLEVETFGEVYEEMAGICKLWRSIISNPAFFRRMKDSVFREGLLTIMMIQYIA